MPLALPVRLAALAAAGLWCAGCGSGAHAPPGCAAPPPAPAPALAAPRPLAAPQDARPLVTAIAAFSESIASERGTSPVVGGARIRQLSPGTGAGAETIRQPAAVVRQPAAPPKPAPPSEPPAASIAQLRSPYQPLAAPPSAALPSSAPMPTLPAVPNFDGLPAPAMASAPPGPSAVAPIPQAARPAQTAFVPSAPSPAAAPVPAAPRQVSLAAIAPQVQAIADRGLAMAQRGMLFAGRAELIKALQLVAQSLDVQEGGNLHAEALASGLVALSEARDFSKAEGEPGAVVDVRAIAQTHRTPLLRTNAAELSPVAAQQQYFQLAQGQLVLAGGGQPVASQVLFRLGRLQTALAAHDAAPQALHGPQAMVFHQAALASDGGNYQAANELGVLWARYGQLDSAKQMLLRSVTIRPQVESWHNLAVVHRRLGEVELARQADHERDLLAKQSGNRGTTSDAVRWVDPRTFAATGAEAAPAARTAAQAVTGASQRR